MKLLHVTHQYLPALGGAEQYIASLSKELVHRGHQVDVFTTRSVDYNTWRTELPSHEVVEGINVYRFRSLQRGQRSWKALEYGLRNYWASGARRYEPFIFFGSGPVCPGMFLAMIRRAPTYDLVHINQLHYSHSWPAYIAAQLRRRPVIITPHVHVEQRVTYDVNYLKNVLRGCDVVIADTTAERDFLLENNLSSTVTVGGVGLSLDEFPPMKPEQARAQFGLPEHAFTMLFLGRKVAYKGLEICLRAFAKLRDVHQDARFLVVGPETDYSRRLWSHYGGLPGLVVRERVSDMERLAALAASDVLVLPSVGEAFGIVYLEAWAYGKPVIGARISSVSSLICDGANGFLVDPTDASELAGRLGALADGHHLRSQMGACGRHRLEQRYTMRRIADIVEGLCARVVRHYSTL